MMNVLVIGSGGREHALAWKIAQSPLVAEVLVAPGNPGTARLDRARNVSLDPGDHAAVVSFCANNAIGLVVIGPEAPLVDGLADSLRAAGIAVVGPGSAGAHLEASKAFAKEVMVAAGVPTAKYARCTTHAEIDTFVDSFDGDALVVKADGLAAGKGVVVCDTAEQAREEAHTMLRERTFGDASDTIVLEERLVGIETSYIVLTDGERFAPFPTSQDHKRLLDGDEGPNTGGMGAFSPAPFVSEAMKHELNERVIAPTLAELRRRAIPFRGFLYAGIMLTARGPYVLEFNTRLGDPETQVLLTALRDDLVPHLLGAANGELASSSLGPAGAAAVIVLAAEGYPASPTRGDVIAGIESAELIDGVLVFHAGTAARDEQVISSGGRVLGVTARADTPERAIALAYAGVARIHWRGMQNRSDIGKAVTGG
jgi:phosphoribosylamine--glycine ligase